VRNFLYFQTLTLEKSRSRRARDKLDDIYQDEGILQTVKYIVKFVHLTSAFQTIIFIILWRAVREKASNEFLRSRSSGKKVCFIVNLKSHYFNLQHEQRITDCFPRTFKSIPEIILFHPHSRLSFATFSCFVNELASVVAAI
jgi:hypothetical protein